MRMGNESYSLRFSREKLGPIVPIILAADGKTKIDGKHRNDLDEHWPTYVDANAKTPLDIAIRRLVVNVQRRTLPASEKAQELDTIASQLTTEQGLRGEALINEIMERTGFSPRWVYKYLPDKWKRRYDQQENIQRADLEDGMNWDDNPNTDDYWTIMLSKLKGRLENSDTAVKLKPVEVDTALLAITKYLA